MLKESAQPDARTSADQAQPSPRDVLWIDKFLAKKQATGASSAGTASMPAAPSASTTPAAGGAQTGTSTPGPASAPIRLVKQITESTAEMAMAASGPHVAESAITDPDPVAAAHRHAVQRLSSLPEAVEQQIAALAGDHEPVSDALLRAVWIALESNTRAVGADWIYVDSRHGYAPPDLTLAAGDAGDALLPRYIDILPPKATAVTDPVRSAEFGGVRYLHANHVDLDCGRRLIAGQKPVAGEVAGMHQMLVDQQVGLIVDLTRYQERENHCTYVPEQQGTCVSARGRKRLVCCTGRSRLHDLKAVRQQISIDDGTTVTRLQRLRFPGWPDHGVIAVADLIALADTIDVLSPDPRRPILVHCLAGVGRSGTLMSFMAARRKLVAAAPPGQACTPDKVIRIVLDTVARGRIARGPSFVQMEEQFHLLVRALLRARPGMVERRQLDVGPGETAAGAALPEARLTPQPDADALPAVEARRGLWQRLRGWCGLD